MGCVRVKIISYNTYVKVRLGSGFKIMHSRKENFSKEYFSHSNCERKSVKANKITIKF